MTSVPLSAIGSKTPLTASNAPDAFATPLRPHAAPFRPGLSVSTPQRSGPTERPVLDSYLMDPRPEKEPTPPSTPVVSSSAALRHQNLSSRNADIRAVCLRSRYAELLPSLLEHQKSADEIKSPYDFWNYVEPMFVPLHVSLFGGSATPALLQEAKMIAAQPEASHYSWVWALEECIDWHAIHRITGNKNALAESVHQLLPRPERNSGNFKSIAELHSSARLNLAETRASNEALLGAIRSAISLTQKSEIEIGLQRKKTMGVLIDFAVALHRKLEQEQCVESIEEVHVLPGDSIVMIFDDGCKVRASLLSRDEGDRLLGSWTSEHPLPFSDCSATQLGPLCHICRQRSPDMPKCHGKVSCFFEAQGILSSDEGLHRRCHRRYCLECLRTYDWPMPPPSGGNWNCPVCSKICTCDRCVRNVYLASTEGFANGFGREVPITRRPGKELSFEEFKEMAANSHVLSTKISSPSKKPKIKLEGSVVSGGSNAVSIDSLEDLVTPQTSRVREQERHQAVLRVLVKTKAGLIKRIGNYRSSLKAEEMELARLQAEIGQVGGESADAFLNAVFPSVSVHEISDSDLPQASEYQRLVNGLALNSKRPRVYPPDSETDEEEERKESKRRKVKIIQGTTAHLFTVCLGTVAVVTAVTDAGYAGGIRGYKFSRISKI